MFYNTSIFIILRIDKPHKLSTITANEKSDFSVDFKMDTIKHFQRF